MPQVTKLTADPIATPLAEAHVPLRPDKTIPPPGDHRCPKCKLLCEVMPIETPDGKASVSMCCHVRVEVKA